MLKSNVHPFVGNFVGPKGEYLSTHYGDNVMAKVGIADRQPLTAAQIEAREIYHKTLVDTGKGAAIGVAGGLGTVVLASAVECLPSLPTGWGYVACVGANTTWQGLVLGAFTGASVGAASGNYVDQFVDLFTPGKK